MLRAHGCDAGHRLARLRPRSATTCVAVDATTRPHARSATSRCCCARRTGAPVVVGARSRRGRRTRCCGAIRRSTSSSATTACSTSALGARRRDRRLRRARRRQRPAAAGRPAARARAGATLGCAPARPLQRGRADDAAARLRGATRAGRRRRRSARLVARRAAVAAALDACASRSVVAVAGAGPARNASSRCCATQGLRDQRARRCADHDDFAPLPWPRRRPPTSS